MVRGQIWGWICEGCCLKPSVEWINVEGSVGYFFVVVVVVAVEHFNSFSSPSVSINCCIFPLFCAALLFISPLLSLQICCCSPELALRCVFLQWKCVWWLHCHTNPSWSICYFPHTCHCHMKSTLAHSLSTSLSENYLISLGRDENISWNAMRKNCLVWNFSF